MANSTNRVPHQRPSASISGPHPRPSASISGPYQRPSAFISGSDLRPSASISGLFLASVVAAVLLRGGVDKAVWYSCLAAIGIATLVYHARTPRFAVPPLSTKALRWALIALPAYVLLQLLPIPAGLLQHLSPARAEITAALDLIGLHQSFASLSVVPSETLFQLSRICGAALLFLAARNLAWRTPERAWRLAFPLIGLACAEAILGLVQAFASPEDLGRGTYVNRNHFAGLLEMILPFAVAFPFVAMRGHRFEPAGLKPALKASASLAAAALLLAAITYSLSRSGFTVALLSLCMMAVGAGAIRLTGRMRTAVIVTAIGALLSLFVLLPPDRLIERFGRLSQADISTDDRIGFWHDTELLIRDYPVFGCGLGGFEPAVGMYRTNALNVRLDYAHNDYLQALAELGLAGFGIVILLIAAVLVEAVRAVRRSSETALALGALGALAAILAHSFTDFNLYIPANAAVAAWIAGIVSGLATAGRSNSDHTLEELCIS